MSELQQRLLTSRANEVCDHIVSHLNVLAFDEGLSVLVSIIAASLNNKAGNEADANMLCDAICEDLRRIMAEGRAGLLREGKLQ